MQIGNKEGWFFDPNSEGSYVYFKANEPFGKGLKIGEGWETNFVKDYAHWIPAHLPTAESKILEYIRLVYLDKKQAYFVAYNNKITTIDTISISNNGEIYTNGCLVCDFDRGWCFDNEIIIRTMFIYSQL